MKIAIVAPSPVPYTVGGMEYLVRGLWEHINDDTPHNAELIKLPVDEGSFWGIIESYKKFYSLDLDHFDMVITTKYPAWMVQHHNHVCYMAHRLRGLYDTYHLTGLPQEVDASNIHVRRVLRYMDRKGSTVDGLFEELDRLYDVQDRVPEEFFSLPGPLLRRIVHFMDNHALSLRNIRRFAAISRTVKGRKDYFPDGARVDVIYPPSFLPAFKQVGYDYLFTISRLDTAKRVALMVEAMKHVKGDIHLKIAGTGPLEDEIKKMAGGDKRIEFLGFISDEEAVEYYANARAVLYIPYDEDYGLVTIEAMMSHKPVITCLDSGGPNEFVEHRVNGLACSPDPREIAAQIEAVCKMPRQQLEEMGQKGFEKVKNITWKTVVDGLTGEAGLSAPVPSGAVKASRGSKKKITIATTFPIYPPKGGGQARVYHLYKAVAQKYDVEVVSFTDHNSQPFSGEIAPGLWETRIRKSKTHHRLEEGLHNAMGFSVADIAMPLLSEHTREYGRALRRSLENSDLAVLCHPYLVFEGEGHIQDKPCIYEAQDVEYTIKKEVLPDTPQGRELLQLVRRTEEKCCQLSSLIMTCSHEDKERLAELYGIPRDRFFVVPNGVDTGATRFTGHNERKALKKQLGIEGEKTALFMGSWHPPNLEACEFILEFAGKTPDIKYLLMGSQCHAFTGRRLPPNVGLLGIVDDDEKQRVFDVVDVALNPVVSGSGTNLKMFDYMAAGIPVITTPFGARGIEDRSHLIIADIEDMPWVIQETVNGDLAGHVQAARKYVEEIYDWAVLAEVLIGNIGKLV